MQVGMDMTEIDTARPVLTSGLVALVFESLLFGTFTILYGACTWVLLVSPKPRGARVRNGMLFIASTIMYALSLVHVAFDVHIALEAFIRTIGDSVQMSGVLDTFNSLGNPFGAAKFAIYVTQTLIGDGFMIYRAYVVWNRAIRIAIVPLALLLAQTVIGYYVSFSGSSSMSSATPASSADALSKTFFLLSTATNFISTGLIMRRILWVDISVQSYYPNDSPVRCVKWRVFESILQSAAIYSVASLSLAVTAFVSPMIAFPACHSVFPSVIGIVFVLIVVRICFNTAPPELPRHSMMMHMNAPSCPNLPMEVQDIEPRSPCSILSVPITIHVSVSTTSDRESELESSITKMADEMECGARELEDGRPMSPTEKVRSLVGEGEP